MVRPLSKKPSAKAPLEKGTSGGATTTEKDPARAPLGKEAGTRSVTEVPVSISQIILLRLPLYCNGK